MTPEQEEPLELDLNVLPTVAVVFGARRREWSQLHMRRVDMLKNRVRGLRKGDYSPELRDRVMEMTNGFSKLYKNELIRVILYTEWEIEHYEETGKVTIGHWKDR